MIYYFMRRLIYSLPILFGINLLTFILFFMVNSPDDMARMQLGQQHTKQKEIDNWKHQHGYDFPLLYNAKEKGIQNLTETLFVKKSMRLFLFDFGLSDTGRDISYEISHRMWPSLAIALPSLILGILANISFAILMIFFRTTVLDFTGIISCIVFMSISTMFYIIAGQYFFAKIFSLVPISGYDSGLSAIKFIILPVFIEVFSGLGAGSRWYRSLFIEEMNKGYVNTARAKGLSEFRILFVHVLKNAMLPILTGIVVLIPSLFMGSLILESFFSIPGLGSYMIDAILKQDFAVVRVMVFLGSLMYIIGLVLTDLSYTLIDPRVRLR